MERLLYVVCSISLVFILGSTFTSACLCSRELSRVCGFNGVASKTYSNECMAKCGGAIYITPGPCNRKNQGHVHNGHINRDRNYHRAMTSQSQSQSCGCPRNYDPVCANQYGQWQTFNNYCIAQCAGAVQVRDGQCRFNRRG